LQPIHREPLIFRVVNGENLLPPDHLARAIGEMTGRLDLTRYTAGVQAAQGEAGRPATDPRVLISLLVYAYSEGVSSPREIDRRCDDHPAYPWLCGCKAVN
jgi:transposase